MIDNIVLPKNIYEHYRIDGDGAHLDCSAKANLFIGPNNCGKSRFLRTLCGSGELISEENLDKLNEWLIGQGNKWSDQVDRFCNRSQVEEHTKKRIAIPDVVPNDRSATIRWLNDVVTRRGKLVAAREVPKELDFPEEQLQNVVNVYDELIKNYEGAKKGQRVNTAVPLRIYIPTLRSLRRIGPPRDEGKSEAPDIYWDRTTDDYFQGVHADIQNNIFTGQKVYSFIEDKLLNVSGQSDQVVEYEKFLSREFFEGKRVRIAPKKSNQTLYLRIGEEEYPVHELGDGIQQVIIMTMPIVVSDAEEVMAFIEEPELYLHPGMLRRLLELFLDAPEFQKCKFFLVTHSNHLLDMTMDTQNISVFRFSKLPPDERDVPPPQFAIQSTSNADFSLLRDIGVRNASVFLTDATIWVEGISDRLYLRKILQIYQSSIASEESSTPPQTFKEDIHYSITEYGGSNLKHWLFQEEEVEEETNVEEIIVRHLCGRALVIADKDIANEDKAEVHKRRFEELGHQYCVLGVNEIENILAPHIVESTLKTYPSLEGLELGGLGEDSHTEYKEKPFGHYLKDKVLPEGKMTSLYYDSDRGTLHSSRKTEFAERACPLMNTEDDLTPVAKELAEKVYNFIRETHEKSRYKWV